MLLMSHPVDLDIDPDSVDRDSDEYWSRVCSRLGNVIPLDTVDAEVLFNAILRFSYDDHALAARALRLARHAEKSDPSSANHRFWILEYAQDYPFLLEDEVTYASNLQSALTQLLNESLSKGEFPTHISVNQDGHISFYGEDVDLWCKFRPWMPGAPIDEALRSRLLNTLAGVSQFDSPGAELVKRIRRLPGWSEIELQGDDRLDDALSRAHFPLTKEWRATARQVLVDLGITDPAAEMIDKVVCAVLGGHNWHQLSAAVKALAEQNAVESFWLTDLSTQEGTRVLLPHGNLASTFHQLTKSALALSGLSPQWKNMTLSLSEAESGIVQMGISVQDASDDNGGRHSVKMYPMYHTDARLCQAFVRDTVRKVFMESTPLDRTALESLFLVNQDRAAQLDSADQSLGLRVIAQHGEIRISVYQPYPTFPAHLRIDYLDKSGRRESGYPFQASLREIGVVFLPNQNLHVITAGKADSSHQIALKGFPPDVLRAIERELDPEVQATVQERCAQMSPKERTNWVKRLHKVTIKVPVSRSRKHTE